MAAAGFSGELSRLSYDRPPVDIETVKSELELICMMEDGHQWWKADILAAVKRNTPWLFHQAAKSSGLLLQSAQIYATTASRFPPRMRTLGVKFAIYVLARTFKDIEDRMNIIRYAKEHKLSEKKAREFMRDYKRNREGFMYPAV